MSMAYDDWPARFQHTFGLLQQMRSAARTFDVTAKNLGHNVIPSRRIEAVEKHVCDEFRHQSRTTSEQDSQPGARAEEFMRVRVGWADVCGIEGCVYRRNQGIG
jgi:hypothetical protein